MVSTDPMLLPRLRAAAYAGEPGEDLAVTAWNLEPGAFVVIGHDARVEDAFRLCGSGNADARGVLNATCRIARTHDEVNVISAFDGELGGRVLASVSVQAHPYGTIEVDRIQLGAGRTQLLSGPGRPNELWEVYVVDAMNQGFTGAQLRVGGDGAWVYPVRLPDNAALGRWNVLAWRTIEPISVARGYFYVTPSVAIEREPGAMEVLGLGFVAGDHVGVEWYDARGQLVAEAAGAATAIGVACVHAAQPECAVNGTWFARVHYSLYDGRRQHFDTPFAVSDVFCGVQ